MRISVFGIGYVGAVTSACLAQLGHHVVGVDLSRDKVLMLNRGVPPIVEPDIATLFETARTEQRLRATVDAASAVAETEMSLISVGTPSMADGSLSLQAVESVLSQIGAGIARKAGPHVVVMRSTVPPGSAEDRFIPLLEGVSGRRLGSDLQYYSNPEFLREGSAVADFHAPPFTLIGSPPGDDAVALRKIYTSIRAPLHLVPYRVAESIKLISNAYHAVKLAFANEAGAILAAHGVDARQAFQYFCQDRILNISPAYLRPGYAFGGSCLPKDLRGFLALGAERNVAAPLLAQVLPSNNAIVERIFRVIAEQGRQPVALFGLAFKPGTDDLRESPFVSLAERLIGKGWDVRIFDRSVHVAALIGGNRDYIEREIPHLERLLATSPAEVLKERRIAVVGHIGPEDRQALLDEVGDRLVFDLVGVPGLQERAGRSYRGICW